MPMRVAQFACGLRRRIQIVSIGQHLHMSNVLRIALVDPNDGSRESLKAMLLGMETVWLEADCSRYEFFPDVIEQTAPDVGVVSLDGDPDRAIEPDPATGCGSSRHRNSGRQRGIPMAT